MPYYEKILKRPDGSQVKVCMNIFVPNFGVDCALTYSWFVTTRGKGKKKWDSVNMFDDYSWRRLKGPERAEYTQNLYLKHISLDEVQQVAVELWETLKPKLNG